MRLFCFPPAGGSASYFDTWLDEIPEWIVVSPVQLPGRGDRANEALLARVEQLVDLLADELLPRLDQPFVLFGHSMGALIAYEVARTLRAWGAPEPRAVYVSGFRAPHLPGRGSPIYSLPDDVFIEELAHLVNGSKNLLDDTELRQLFLPLLRADVELCESYQHVPDEPLSCALRVFGGRNDGSVGREELAGWRRHTRGPFRLEMFPGDHSFPVTARGGVLRALRDDLHDLCPEHRARQVEFEVPDETTGALARRGQREGERLPVVLLAAYAVLLGRYAEQDEVVIGTLPGGRGHGDGGWVILRVDVPLSLRFGELLDAVAEAVAAARPQPEARWGPPSRMAFSFDGDADAACGRTLDLILRLDVRGAGLHGRLEYDTDLYDDETAARMAASYVAVLGAVAAGTDAAVGSLPLLADTDREDVLVRWNNAMVPDVVEPDVMARFEAIAAARPVAAAFTDDTTSLSFEELRRRSNQLAHRLVDLGVGPELPVGVCIERSCDVPVVLLAVWKAGGAWLPLDPSYPPDRLRFMLRDAGAAVVVTTSRLARLFPTPAGLRTVRLDEDALAISAGPPTDPGRRVAPDQLAAITYTSGSTGLPKGVAIEHRQILNRLVWMWEAYPFAPGEVGAQITATSFVDSLWELLGPLLCGTPTVIVRHDRACGVIGLVDTLAAVGVTRLWLVPSQLRAILDACPDVGERLPRLRFWVSTGEALPAELYERFQRVMPHATLYNLYGASEVWDATWYDPRAHGEPRRRVPIGRPIRNVQVYVLDAWQQPVPPGAVGELFVGGQGLARGYVGRPDLTAERFVLHPFDPAPGARLYRTGDRARHLPGGTLELLGRRDDQLSVRGFRVERGEVEAHLAEHPAVREVAVTVTEAASGGPRLVAHVVAKGDPAPGADELRAYLGRRLPQPCVPNAFVALDALPLTPSGKVDYRRLQAGRAIRSTRVSAYVAPRTALERVVAELWCDVLQEPRVGLDDDFFILGGHSLLAAGMVSQLRNILGAELALGQFFEAPTVAGLVAAITADPATRARVYARAERRCHQLRARR
ncbi:MAG: non-ribosomal peptide synthetase [Acidimicrobiales bacterium]